MFEKSCTKCLKNGIGAISTRGPEKGDKQLRRMLLEATFRLQEKSSQDSLVVHEDLICKSWVKKDQEEERIIERGW